jgi:hypothetical protein
VCAEDECEGTQEAGVGTGSSSNTLRRYNSWLTLRALDRTRVLFVVLPWPIATFRVGAAVRSLLERSGHQVAGRTGWLSREWPEADLRRHAGIRDSNTEGALNGKEAQDGFLIKARKSMTDFHRWL